jgi:uncharacterized DUF497 family protein
MRYEWDQRTNRENQRKHGVSFDLATLVREDENCLVSLDRVFIDRDSEWLCNKGTASHAAEKLNSRKLCNKGTASAGP